jgi:hypothetical protein
MTERRPPSFKQHDVTRALKAAMAAGLHVTGVEIDPASGKIVIRTGADAPSPAGDLDKWLASHAH